MHNHLRNHRGTSNEVDEANGYDVAVYDVSTDALICRVCPESNSLIAANVLVDSSLDDLVAEHQAAHHVVVMKYPREDGNVGFYLAPPRIESVAERSEK